MKHQGVRNQGVVLQKSPKLVLLAFSTLVLLTIFIPLCYPSISYSSIYLVQSISKPPPSFDHHHHHDDDEHHSLPSTSSSTHKCDIFTGEWVPNPKAPYYTNRSCWAIHEHQNCMKYGRPDSEFMKWRWKPDGCELPIFNPAQFLELVRDKSLAFVGDSVGRNQMQSLICLLSRVTSPSSSSSSS
ncbi:hypothetical protein FNV43_RR13637 [Rhamnella rubrinervis]|uniref:Trichome birefringence-like N-terminal domain-containing protein n=1 Tax=Rhamnella rubrinervis TaxID=2594499 RepID=A0A8K0MFH0_9ROSA|nr:hypothetical protein FNV43_RR13637 [Rhamnella rubrinervis]